jgi:hypothetical protein
MDTVTKSQFEEAYRKFPPDKVELFFLKYISAHSLRSNKWLAIFLGILIVFPVLFEFAICALGFPSSYKIYPTIVYMWVLTNFGLLWFIVVMKKHRRLEKVRKHLGITKEHFKSLTDIFFYNRYASTEKYIKYNSK